MHKKPDNILGKTTREQLKMQQRKSNLFGKRGIIISAIIGFVFVALIVFGFVSTL